ncbi:carboxylesterase [Microcoleus sp. bin38.metabat.b11b12b14.051]|uniref:alpha/beta hydrolase n=1 Tax=Microcoleus sp. bin38.metabat.b11b12b14.051 TaxID=2742709 RepID=UPI0025FA4DEA|nr:alpha/beta hydrolase [Microcoleus sp. bin38.metabat.b11b12b14.051]
MSSVTLHSRKPQPPTEPDYSYISPTYQTSIAGSHQQGNYIKSYVPDTPYRDPKTNNFKAVVYLHGFSLGIPALYETHLEHLVKQGYFVFFPDYQKDSYKDEGQCQIEHEIELISAVVESLHSSPKDWIKAAIKSTSGAFDRVTIPQTQPAQKLSDANIDVYFFGHSMGGLFALSWPYYLSQEQQKLMPLQVVAADPVPDSLSNLPAFVRDLLDRYFKGSPFVKNPMKIEDTGKSLTVPVAILHGKQDTIVSPCSWKHPFEAIASKHKKIYFSNSDDTGNPSLSANHNQSVTDTKALLPDFLAKALGGAKSQADDLNWRYIWFALDRAIQGTAVDTLQFDMGKWSNNTPVKPIDESWPKKCESLEATTASLRQSSVIS